MFSVLMCEDYLFCVRKLRYVVDIDELYVHSFNSNGFYKGISINLVRECEKIAYFGIYGSSPCFFSQTIFVCHVKITNLKKKNLVEFVIIFVQPDFFFELRQPEHESMEFTGFYSHIYSLCFCCCPWRHGLRPKELYAWVAVLPAHVRVPNQWPLSLSAPLSTSRAGLF